MALRPLTSFRAARDERGAVLILTALVMMILLLIAAFATDLGAWYRQGQEQQRAADVASLNGVQAYDANIKAYLDTAGTTSFALLNGTQQAEAEDQAMQNVVASVLGALAAGGMNITDTPVITTGIPPAESTATVTAADGTEITITRTATNAITVTIGREGTQYFSNFVRDAPQISREGTAVISNCNADCGQEIVLEPPFQGFDAAGSGDGYRPLVDLDNGRVWLINHLWDATSHKGAFSEVVCMDIREQAICPDWAPLSKEFYGNMMPDEAIDLARNRLYYPGMGRSVSPDSNGRRLGDCTSNGNVASQCEFFIACVDTASRGHCEPTKIGDGAWGGGPWLIDGNVWAVSAEGNIFCIDPDHIGTGSHWCNGYSASGRSTVATGSVTPGTHERALITGGVLGSSGHKLVIYHARSNVFHCWDTITNADCAGFGLVNGSTDYSNSWIYASRFHRYDTSGNIVGWCVSRSNGWVNDGPLLHTCVTETGTLSHDPIPNISNGQDQSLTWNQYHTWLGPNGEARMFFSGYAPVYWNNGSLLDPGVINCYDWVTQSMCSTPEIDAGDAYDFYAFAPFDDDCLVAVGDQAKFYTFSPVTFDVCTSSSVDDTIYPCDCGNDSGEKRWGTVALPDDFLAVLDAAHAFVLDGNQIIDVSDGSYATGTPSVDHPLAHDLIGEGELDLSGLNGIFSSSLELKIIVDAKVEDDGSLKWTEPMAAYYSLVVQPTLTGN